MNPSDDLNSFALGVENTSSFEARFVDGVQFHCYDLMDSDECINGHKKSKPREDVVLWLGNSQLHAINQFKVGDTTAAHKLHQNLAAESRYLLTYSQPNANLQEHYILFEYLAQKLPVTTLILPVVFDDMRETGVRNTLADLLKNQSVIKRIIDTEIGRSLYKSEIDQDLSGNDMIALQDTIQEKSEKYLNKSLGEIWEIWSERPKFRGEVFTNLYLFRNWIFGINATSSTRVIPNRYVKNIQSLDAILQSAKELKINVLIYIPPLRNDVKIPYNLEQYDNFKTDIQLTASRYNIEFINLESLVPAKFWGTKDATTLGGMQELDFMHFQSGGHDLLADTLYGKLKTFWKNKK